MQYVSPQDAIVLEKFLAISAKIKKLEEEARPYRDHLAEFLPDTYAVVGATKGVRVDERVNLIVPVEGFIETVKAHGGKVKDAMTCLRVAFADAEKLFGRILLEEAASEKKVVKVVTANVKLAA